jgi:hypothetical protein
LLCTISILLQVRCLSSIIFSRLHLVCLNRS